MTSCVWIRLLLMKSAIRLILGLSMCATAIGCDNAGEETEPDGPNAVAGTNSTTAGTTGVLPTGGSSSGGGDTGGTGSGVLPEGIALTATDGWVAVDSNSLGIQGAMFAYADETSKLGPPAMTEDFLGANACIKGTAAKVDLKCTPVAPAVDCYGNFWGAAIGLNLNQPIDEATGEGVMTPLPFDASAIKGFAFEISGAAVPISLRFKVEDASGEFCNLPAKKVAVGPNQFDFAELTTECWKPTATSRKGDTAKAAVLKIAWQVVTNDKATVPFDYCVSNVRTVMQ